MAADFWLVFWSVFFCGAPMAVLEPLVAIFGISEQNHAERWHREPLASSFRIFSRGRQKVLKHCHFLWFLALRRRFWDLSLPFSECLRKTMQNGGIESLWRRVFAYFAGVGTSVRKLSKSVRNCGWVGDYGLRSRLRIEYGLLRSQDCSDYGLN